MSVGAGEPEVATGELVVAGDKQAANANVTAATAPRNPDSRQRPLIFIYL
jgi:hypothetical protein